MNITDDIKKVIEAQLPAAVGDLLKQRLLQADALEKHNADLQKIAEQNNRLIAELRGQLQDQAAVTRRAEEIKKQESAVAAREQACALNEVRLECAKERIADLKEITAVVFSNNRFKYSEVGDVPLVLPGSTSPGGYSSGAGVSSGVYSKRVEGEGTPPAAGAPR